MSGSCVSACSPAAATAPVSTRSSGRWSARASPLTVTSSWASGTAGRARSRVCPEPLGIAEVRGILPRGGTILGSSRTNPFKIENGVERIKDNLAAQGVDALIAIGGEDTLGVATKLYELGVHVVGVPKTIDNDLGATDYTFGFDTAVNIAMEAIDRLHTTAESHHRTLVVEVMGRHAGWIALHAGLAGGANVILLPERQFDVEQVAGYVEKRFQHQYAPIVVVAEGAQPLDGQMVLPTRSSTRSATSASAASASGSPSSWRPRPARRPAPWCWATSSAVAPRPPSTGCSPPASGLQAIDAVNDGDWGKMVAMQSTDIVRVPLAEATRELKTVPLERYAEAEVFFGS